MLTNKSKEQLYCEYADVIYDEFLSKVYGVKSCKRAELLLDKEDYRLEIALKNAGIFPDRKTNGKVNTLYQSKSKGVESTTNDVNNTYVTNNYTTVVPSGYVHNQTGYSTTWTVNNPLKYFPNITIVDENGFVMDAQIQYLNNDYKVIVITFSEATKGKAFLS